MQEAREIETKKTSREYKGDEDMGSEDGAHWEGGVV